MTIGIPRALIYWKRPYFWESFFENLGFEVLLSPKTNKEIVEEGVKISDPETCFSNKVYFGHLKWLEGKVDYISSEVLSKNYCSICSQISFDNSVKSIFENKSFFDKKDFYSYLSKNKISDEQTYENYFLINGILNYPGKFGEVDLSKQYYSLMGITSKVSKVGWVLGGALTLGALASIPLTGGVSVIAIGTAVGGAVVGGSAGWIASSYLLVPSIKGPSENFYIPPSVIEVTSSEFDSLNCDKISTSS